MLFDENRNTIVEKIYWIGNSEGVIGCGAPTFGVFGAMRTRVPCLHLLTSTLTFSQVGGAVKELLEARRERRACQGPLQIKAVGMIPLRQRRIGLERMARRDLIRGERRREGRLLASSEISRW
jgi:hypothetical protein